MIGPDLGDQECAIALAGDHTADQFLGATRFFLGGFRMSSLSQTRRALTERREDGVVVEFHRLAF